MRTRDTLERRLAAVVAKYGEEVARSDWKQGDQRYVTREVVLQDSDFRWDNDQYSIHAGFHMEESHEHDEDRRRYGTVVLRVSSVEDTGR